MAESSRGDAAPFLGEPREFSYDKLAAVLFALGLLILVWPVSSKASYNGKFTPTGGAGAELCGPAIAQAFVAPSGDDDNKARRKIDCASKARGRIGTGVLFLLLGIPPAFLALRPAKERAPSVERASPAEP